MAAAASPSVRAAISSERSGPRSRSRSCTPSAPRARRSSASRCSSSSTWSRASGSSSSRRSSSPSSSRSRSRSSDSAAARRSASGASPSYMNTATHANSSERANGDAVVGVDRHDPDARARGRRSSAGAAPARRRWSRRHSRVASSRIGKSGWFDAAAEQVGAALALLPQRRALAGPAPGEQERARGGLAEDRRRTARCPAAPRRRPSSISSGSKQQVLGRDRLHRLGQAQHDAVVGPQDLGAGPEPLG